MSLLRCDQCLLYRMGFDEEVKWERVLIDSPSSILKRNEDWELKYGKHACSARNRPRTFVEFFRSGRHVVIAWPDQLCRYSWQCLRSERRCPRRREDFGHATLNGY